MADQITSNRIAEASGVLAPVLRFFSAPWWQGKVNEPDVSNFLFGNPQELPLQGFVDALTRWSAPQNKDWFAYKNNEPEQCALVASILTERRGIPFEPADIFLTNGAFAGISVILSALVNPGDEVIFISPPWFFYEAMIVSNGGKPVRVKIDLNTFDLDLDAISRAITGRTRAIIVNSPNNPTGKIYPPATLKALANLLTEASERNKRPIYLLSDEAYSRIIFDERDYPTPLRYYSNSLMIYTYAKTLLIPGQRVGYIALPPTMPNRETMRQTIFTAQLLAGWSFPNALLQHALADLEKLSIDIEGLQARRDNMVAALRKLGYDLHSPEGTFYLLVRSPLADDWAFCELLATHDVLCLPGTVVEMPGYFRISLTANEQMIGSSLAGFAAAMKEATEASPVA